LSWHGHLIGDNELPLQYKDRMTIEEAQTKIKLSRESHLPQQLQQDEELRKVQQEIYSKR
jgi:hypothetical protein